MKRLAFVACVGIGVSSCVALSPAAEGPAAEQSAERQSQAAKADPDVAGGGYGPGSWGYHPWHPWHRGHWAGGGWGWARPWNWGWSGPWAAKFAPYGPGAGQYSNPFCGECRPLVLRESYVRRRRDDTFRFGGGLQSPNEERTSDYYEEASVSIDYSKPLDTTQYVDLNVDRTYPPGAPLVSEAARSALSSARAAFRRSDYNLALQYVNSALVRMPRDAATHEFRALVLFALGKYAAAATTLNSLLAVGPGWNWQTMAGFYPDVAVYTSQLRQLEAYTRDNPHAAEVHFLLAYHYLSEGYPEAAVKRLQQVLQLVPQAEVASRLLQKLAPPPDAEKAVPASPPADTSSAAADAGAKRLVGTWKATLPGGTAVTMTLGADSGFTWSFNRQGQTVTLSGTYTPRTSTLLLDDRSAGRLAGYFSFAADGALNFKVPRSPAGQGETVFRR